MKLGTFGAYERIMKRLILLLIHRAVNIVIVSAAVIA